MAEILWNKGIWNKVKGEIQYHETDGDSMKNKEIQEKILDIVKKHYEHK